MDTFAGSHLVSTADCLSAVGLDHGGQLMSAQLPLAKIRCTKTALLFFYTQ